VNLTELIYNSRIQLKPNWLLSSVVCLFYALIISIPSEMNTFGEFLSILLAGPLQLGLCIYFLKISKGSNPSFNHIFEGFRPLLNILLAFLSVNIITLIGLFFLILPGIILSLGLSMTYYIIAENPEIPFHNALEKSWKIMDGRKMQLFKLHLYFIPWYILGTLFFIVGVFVVIPWHNLSLANYYKIISENNFEHAN
tara:strand:- start:247 stop:837 length:591 start_codon:yes stop_codon:yes gene_type:complete